MDIPFKTGTTGMKIRLLKIFKFVDMKIPWIVNTGVYR
jgi:hypothetical protein